MVKAWTSWLYPIQQRHTRSGPLDFTLYNRDTHAQDLLTLPYPTETHTLRTSWLYPIQQRHTRSGPLDFTHPTETHTFRTSWLYPIQQRHTRSGPLDFTRSNRDTRLDSNCNPADLLWNTPRWQVICTTQMHHYIYINRCIPSSSWPSLASKYLVLPHFVLCLKVLCLLVLHWIALSHLLFYWFGLLPLRPHIVWDFPVWSFSILSSLVFVLYHMVL